MCPLVRDFSEDFVNPLATFSISSSTCDLPDLGPDREMDAPAEALAFDELELGREEVRDPATLGSPEAVNVSLLIAWVFFFTLTVSGLSRIGLDVYEELG